VRFATNYGTKIIDGIVFDVPNSELGHHGEDASFNSILKKYNLTDPALLLLAEISAHQMPESGISPSMAIPLSSGAQLVCRTGAKSRSA
jgi:hypothetical protein